MLLHWLQSRQTSRASCCTSTSKLIRVVSKRLVSQSLSTFFPTLGSIGNTVVLGYTSCGNHLVVLQNGSILMFSLILSLRVIVIGPLYCKLKIRSSAEVAHCPAVVEVMLLKCNPHITATLIVSVEECTTQNKVLCGRFRVFLEDRLVVSEESCCCTLRNNAMYSFGNNDNTAILLNSGTSLNFYLVLYCRKTELPNQMNGFATAFDILIQRNDLQSYSAKIKRWHSLSSVEHSHIRLKKDSQPLSLTSVRSVINLEVFCDQYLHSLHPAAYQRGSQFDLEFRIIGPCDSGTEFFCALGVSFTHLQAGLQSVGLLLIIHPLVDKIVVLKACDLAALCSTNKAEFAAFRHQLKLKRISEDMSWLSTAVDFYTQIVHTTYDQLLFGCSASNINSKCSPYCVLSNINMVLNGESMTQLMHPFVPVVVVNDEEETQNEEILFNNEDLY